MKPHMNSYAQQAQATILGVPRSMWRQFGIRSMPTLKAYNMGKECPAIRGRNGNAFKQSLDSCGGGAPAPRPPPPTSDRRRQPPPPSKPSGGGGSVRWDVRQNQFIIQNNGNYFSGCPSNKGYRKMNTQTGPICIKRTGSDITNEAKGVCAGSSACKAVVLGKCRS